MGKYCLGESSFHLVVFQVHHLLCEGSLCCVNLLQPLERNKVHLNAFIFQEEQLW